MSDVVVVVASSRGGGGATAKESDDAHAARDAAFFESKQQQEQPLRLDLVHVAVVTNRTHITSRARVVLVAVSRTPADRGDGE